MTDELESLEFREKEIPPWIRIPIALVLGFLTLALGYALTFGLLLTPNEKAPILAMVVGLVLLFVCVWVLEMCFRLVIGRKIRGGLMSPSTLRMLSICFLLLPFAGLFTGYYRQHGHVAVHQAVMYFFAFLGLRKLAQTREGTAGEDLASDSHKSP